MNDIFVLQISVYVQIPSFFVQGPSQRTEFRYKAWYVWDAPFLHLLQLYLYLFVSSLIFSMLSFLSYPKYSYFIYLFLSYLFFYFLSYVFLTYLFFCYLALVFAYLYNWPTKKQGTWRFCDKQKVKKTIFICSIILK